MALDKADTLVKEAYRATLVGNDKDSFLQLVRLIFFARTIFGRPLETIRSYMPDGNSSQELADDISVRQFVFLKFVFRYSISFQWVEFQSDVIVYRYSYRNTKQITLDPDPSSY
jgi:hypothetical protein